MKLPISRVFAAFGKYPEALQLAQEYVSIYSNDWHGWRIIGGANALMTNWNAALTAYTNAVLLGDEDSSASLGSAALQADRLGILHEFLPQLFRLKNSQSKKAIQASTMLVIYSLRTEQKDIFVKALDGINPKDILAHEDVTFLVRQGCKEFKGKDIDKIRQEMESAISSTNSVSNPTH
jgi:tetratricopeptide (TPR) repeat protein